MKRYEILAQDIRQSVASGVLRVGDRLPSVRDASATHGVSPSTVFKAYYLLEAQGVLRARERSGYYVAGGLDALPLEIAAPADEEAASSDVDVSATVLQVLGATLKQDGVSFGSAFLSPSAYPHGRLAKAMSSAVLRLDPTQSIEDTGNVELRRAIALRYMADGLQVHPDDIVITNGALEALNLCLSALTTVGDAVIVESPTFYAALQSLERNGLRAVEVATHPREGIDLVALERALIQHTPRACWLMTNFQNPLGSSMSDSKKQALVALLARYQVPLIEDDVYGELYFGKSRPKPAKAFDLTGMVLHCSSFSKTLAPGYRVGWVLAGKFLSDLRRDKLTTSLATATPTQAAIVTYLEKGGYDRHLRVLRANLSQQLNEMLGAISRYFPEGTRTTRPVGGYFLWVELPVEVDTLALHRRAVAQGISIAPGPMFSAQKRFKNCLRLNYGSPWDSAREDAMKQLGELMRSGMTGDGTSKLPDAKQT